MTAETQKSDGRGRAREARRVQRVPSTWPVLHLESELPTVHRVVVDGLVSKPCSFTLEGLAQLPTERSAIPLHCVWGWSRPDAVWDGVRMRHVLEMSGPNGDFVVVRSCSGSYSSCLPLADAADGMLAWGRDGELLSPEGGGPVRFVAPPRYWGYKSVKWVGRITVVNYFVPGLWESKVDDPVGRIPDDLEVA